SCACAVPPQRYAAANRAEAVARHEILALILSPPMNTELRAARLFSPPAGEVEVQVARKPPAHRCRVSLSGAYLGRTSRHRTSERDAALPGCPKLASHTDATHGCRRTRAGLHAP